VAAAAAEEEEEEESINLEAEVRELVVGWFTDSSFTGDDRPADRLPLSTKGASVLTFSAAASMLSATHFDLRIQRIEFPPTSKSERS